MDRYLRSQDYQLGIGLKKNGSGIVKHIEMKCKKITSDWIKANKRGLAITKEEDVGERISFRLLQ